MKALFVLSLFSGLFGQAVVQAAECAPDSLLDYQMKPLRGEQTVNFCDAYKGKVILAVNTASQCGFTPQFKGLEALYQKYRDQGLVVLGFPSNDFWQEHSSSEKTAEVCYLNYGVTFPMFSKSSVKGKEANAFFQNLIQQSGQSPKWNFYKYLLDTQGRVVKVYASTTAPDDAELIKDIERVLASASAGG
ncbi:MAG: glutathione peroxidase [Methylococcaceae bacterium]